MLKKNFFKIIRQLLPPIFYPNKIKEIICYFTRDKDKITYEKNFYNRISFILRAISKFDLETCKYLEIGVSNNIVFNSIPLKIENKIGIDPAIGGTHRMTSDIFFSKNNLKFDVIFIDGLHHYKQCQKDCINSLKYLNSQGIILLHDLLPRNSFEELVPQKQSSWTGDVWKVAVELTQSKNIDFCIVNIDKGVGIVKPRKDYEYKINNDLMNLRFEDFIKNFYPTLPRVNSEDALKFISQ